MRSTRSRLAHRVCAHDHVVEVRLSRRFLSLVAAVAGTLGLAACTEQLESGAGCPVLCPQPAIELRDTVIEAVVVDSTLTGFPAIGFEEFPLLANRGDTLETRVIVRFDSLPTTYVRSGPGDSAIVRTDSATLNLRLLYPIIDSTRVYTVRAYDVDTAVADNSLADTSVATLLPLFRPDRLLGSVGFVPTALTDSVVRIPLDTAALLRKIQNGQRLRIGLLLDDGTRGGLRLAGQGPGGLSIRFRANPDTAVAAPVIVLPRSKTPADPLTAAALVDYQIVVRGFLPPSDMTLAVGGVPGRRTYLRFELPRRITDSTRVVRAALLLTQRPNPQSAQRGDTVRLAPEVLVAGGTITNLERAVRFTSRTFGLGGSLVGISDIVVVPEGSGPVTVDIAPLVAAWSFISADTVPRALVLRALQEGAGPTVLFPSREAAPDLRPRLRLTYAPSLEFGLP